MPKKIRFPAEWEKQDFIQLTFPHDESDWGDQLEEVENCFIKIIQAITADQKVVVACRNVFFVRKKLSNCPPERLNLVEVDSNDVWARDHGAITVFKDGEPILLDFQFNGWGLKFPADKDNLISKILFEKAIYNADKLKTIGMVLEGGSLESDGAGTLLTTTQCLLSPNRNPAWSQKKMEKKLSKYLGVDRFLWLENGHLIGDDTDGHIDTLARFCAPGTIAYVQCNDMEDPHFSALLEMEKELRLFKTRQGNPYRLIPLPLPDPCFGEEGHRMPATYANFLIGNKAVYLPIYNQEKDKIAQEQLQAVFPNRKIIPINCLPLIEQHGSLHCATMQFPSSTN